jgi:hypothetical protein
MSRHLRGGKWADCNLQLLIDSRKYKEAFTCMVNDMDNLNDIRFNNYDGGVLTYLIENNHYDLYVALMNVVDEYSLTGEFLDLLAKLVNSNTRYDWITPALPAVYAYHAIGPPNESITNLIQALATDSNIMTTIGQVKKNSSNEAKFIIHIMIYMMQGGKNVREAFSQLYSVSSSHEKLYHIMDEIKENRREAPLKRELEWASEWRLLTIFRLKTVDRLDFELVQDKVPDFTREQYVTFWKKKLMETIQAKKHTNVLSESFPKHADMMTRGEWDSLLGTICNMLTFDFSRLLALYLEFHPMLTEWTNVDSHVKNLVDKGFAISGSSNFSKFISHLQEMMNEYQDSAINAALGQRASAFLSYFVDTYRDIPRFVEYTYSLSPKAVDALYMYAMSSAVVNEPFKVANYTASQKKLEASRRRPTQIQHGYISIMDDIVRNAPTTTRPLTAWRGVAVPSFNVVNMHLDIFKSLSLSPDVSRTYLRDQKCCLMRVTVPPGVPLVTVDPVQSYKGEGGLYEYLLPRGAVFRLVEMFLVNDTQVYDCIVDFDEDYEKNLAVGTLRKRPAKEMETETYVDHTTKRKKIPPGTIKKQYTFNDIDVVAGTVMQTFNYEAISSMEEVNSQFEKFEHALLEVGNTWRVKKLARGEPIEESQFTEFIRDVCTYIANALHTPFKLEFLTKIATYLPNIDHFYAFPRTGKEGKP